MIEKWRKNLWMFVSNMMDVIDKKDLIDKIVR